MYIVLSSLTDSETCLYLGSVHSTHQCLKTRAQSLFLALGTLVRPGVNF